MLEKLHVYIKAFQGLNLFILPRVIIRNNINFATTFVRRYEIVCAILAQINSVRKNIIIYFFKYFYLIIDV